MFQPHCDRHRQVVELRPQMYDGRAVFYLLLLLVCNLVLDRMFKKLSVSGKCISRVAGREALELVREFEKWDFTPFVSNKVINVTHHALIRIS